MNFLTLSFSLFFFFLINFIVPQLPGCHRYFSLPDRPRLLPRSICTCLGCQFYSDIIVPFSTYSMCAIGSTKFKMGTSYRSGIESQLPIINHKSLPTLMQGNVLQLYAQPCI